MNGDLISRTSLLRNIGRYGVSIDPYNITRLITQKILAEPEVDAKPVLHGKWIDRGDYITTAYGSLDLKICSNCNAEVTLDGYDDYCPNCGAKMDGDNDAAD